MSKENKKEVLRLDADLNEITDNQDLTTIEQVPPDKETLQNGMLRLMNEYSQHLDLARYTRETDALKEQHKAGTSAVYEQELIEIASKIKELQADITGHETRIKEIASVCSAMNIKELGGIKFSSYAKKASSGSTRTSTDLKALEGKEFKLIKEGKEVLFFKPSGYKNYTDLIKGICGQEYFDSHSTNSMSRVWNTLLTSSDAALNVKEIVKNQE